MASIRTPTISAIFLALLLLPVVSEAQARRAAPRASPGAGPQRTAVQRAPYNRPVNGGRYYNGGHYYGARYYGARYYGPRYYYGGYYGYPYYGGGFAYYGAGYGLSIGVGVGYPYGYAYGYPAYAYGYPYAYPYDLSSSLRLQVTPRETEVYIDGYPAGTVDNFDGTFQRLRVGPGNHTVELYLPGHRVFERKVLLQPSNTLNVHHTMEPLASGEAEPSRPVAPPPPPRGSSSAGADRRSVSPGQFGSLVLRVQPGGAQVMIDGETWESGDSDRLIVELGSGVHTIEIRKDGFRTYITDVTIRPNETTPLNVAMNRQ